MHGKDRLGARRDQVFQQLLIEVQRVRPDVDKYRARSAQDERIDGRDKSERRHDDLIAGGDSQQEGAHLQGVRARCGQQCTRAAQLLFQVLVAAVRVGSVAGAVAAQDGVCNVRQLVSHETGLVEGNSIRAHGRSLASGSPSSVLEFTAKLGRSMVRRWIRAMYSPIIPSAHSWAPERIAMMDARNGNPRTSDP